MNITLTDIRKFDIRKILKEADAHGDLSVVLEESDIKSINFTHPGVDLVNHILYLIFASHGWATFMQLNDRNHCRYISATLAWTPEGSAVFKFNLAKYFGLLGTSKELQDLRLFLEVLSNIMQMHSSVGIELKVTKGVEPQFAVVSNDKDGATRAPALEALRSLGQHDVYLGKVVQRFFRNVQRAVENESINYEMYVTEAHLFSRLEQPHRNWAVKHG